LVVVAFLLGSCLEYGAVDSLADLRPALKVGAEFSCRPHRPSRLLPRYDHQKTGRSANRNRNESKTKAKGKQNESKTAKQKQKHETEAKMREKKATKTKRKQKERNKIKKSETAAR
jgi:hypothetical protein